MNQNNQITPEDRIKDLHGEILESYSVLGGINHLDGANLPSYPEVADIVNKMMYLFFPGFYNPQQRIFKGNIKHWSGYLLDSVHQKLSMQVQRCVCFGSKDPNHKNHVQEAQSVTLEVLEQIPQIRVMLKKDVEAAFIGDPAAQSHEEVILAYPAVQAIAMYRFAHELYKEKSP